jgi:glycosyltransferase involved in cell wall biosynthesis
MIERITPVILTHNESPNISRTLEKLRWAHDIVVVDSHSTDDTLELASSFPAVRIFQRPFDNHCSQWSYAVTETEIQTDWVLALDADYLLTDALVEELRGLDPSDDIRGYAASFVYCVFGRRLRGSLYPPVTVLYRRDGAHYVQDGHTQRVQIRGKVADLRSPILHDDRKSVSSWIQSQNRYMLLEAEFIRRRRWKDLRWSDRMRKLRLLAPFAVLLYCLIAKGGLFQGRAGWFYAFQRMTAELLLSLHLSAPDLLGGSERSDQPL